MKVGRNGSVLRIMQGFRRTEPVIPTTPYSWRSYATFAATQRMRRYPYRFPNTSLLATAVTRSRKPYPLSATSVAIRSISR